MTTAMESIKEMVDVNTIVGDAVQSPDGTVIIPISKVTFGFAAGGGEYSNSTEGQESESPSDSSEDEEGGGNGRYPFAGGSGAGVSINPVAFMVVGNGQIKLLPVNVNSSVDKILDLIPELFYKLEDLLKKRVAVKKETRTESSETPVKEGKSE